jgi:hypothetical protein
MNAPVNTLPHAMPSTDAHPTDKEIALLAFEHWRNEGCRHLRPEHWLTAEKELKVAYANQGPTRTAAEANRLENFWEREMETVFRHALNSEPTHTTKGWS